MLRERHVRADGVVYIYVIALERAVTPDLKCAPGGDATKRIWNEPAPIGVPRPVHIAAAYDRDGKGMRLAIHLRDKVSTAL